jgi:hypothetical protein
MRAFWACVLVICIALSAIAATQRHEATHLPLIINLEWSSAYDDNIFLFSERDLHRWANGTLIVPNPNSTWDDWRNDLGITLTLPWKHPNMPDWETRVQGSAKAALYAVNHRKNYQRYSAGVRQAFGREFWAELSFAIVPSFYLREFRDIDLNQLPYLSRFAGCTYESRTYNLTLRYQSPWRTYFYPELEFKTLYYNRYFTEFDAQWTTLGLTAEQLFSKGGTRSVVSQSSQWLLRGSYRFTNGDNVGGGGLTAASPDEDTEYGNGNFHENEFGLSASYRARSILRKQWEFSMDGKLRIRDYTTNKIISADPFHAGRRDIRWDLVPELTVDIIRNLSVYANFTYQQRRTGSDVGYVVEIKSFVHRVYTAGLEFQLRPPPHRRRR